MDSLVWIIYLIDTLDKIALPGYGTFFTVILFGYLAYFMKCLVINGLLGEEREQEVARKMQIPFASWGWRILVVLLFGVCTVGHIFNTMLPTKDTAYKMLAAYAVQEIAENEDVQRIGGKSLLLVERTIEKYIDEGLEEGFIDKDDILNRAQEVIENEVDEATNTVTNAVANEVKEVADAIKEGD
jgi:hypothetical protein